MVIVVLHSDKQDDSKLGVHTEIIITLIMFHNRYYSFIEFNKY